MADKIKSKKNKIRLPRLIRDGMVLQRGTKTRIWGWAPSGQEITISFLGNKYCIVTDNHERWEAMLPALDAGGPYEMIIEGETVITLKDILIGEVWVCSGQSNMELPMERVKDRYKEEIENCQNFCIRQFDVPQQYDFNIPHQDLSAGEWKTANLENILHFSAVGYFFAKSLNKKYNVPVGIIKTPVGGSPVEAWISKDGLKKFPNYLEIAKKYKDREYVKSIINEDEKAINRWYENLRNIDKGLSNREFSWYDKEFNVSEWACMEIPKDFGEAGLKNFIGVIWFRKEINIPAYMIGKTARIWMGRIVDSDTVYINGVKVGETGYQYPPRKYDIPAGLLKEGKNTIAIRVVCNNGQGGFIKDKPYKLIIGEYEIELKGKWKYKVGAVKENPIPESSFIEWKPMGLFNGIIHPLVNYVIKGVIWYQGESNTSNPEEYKELFSTLINDWRRKWNQDKLPFAYVQLPNYGEENEKPSESNWAKIREAQLQVLTVPDTAMSVAIDLGEWNDLHPLNKKDVGNRLARAAEYIAYENKNIVHSGPIYQSIEKKEQKIIIYFTNIGEGLIVKGDGELSNFAIAGPDKEFVWAEAKITRSRDKVVVWDENILNPVAVRYAWADNPGEVKLYNEEGLPASPFRTDEW